MNDIFPPNTDLALPNNPQAENLPGSLSSWLTEEILSQFSPDRAQGLHTFITENISNDVPGLNISGVEVNERGFLEVKGTYTFSSNLVQGIRINGNNTMLVINGNSVRLPDGAIYQDGFITLPFSCVVFPQGVENTSSTMTVANEKLKPGYSTLALSFQPRGSKIPGVGEDGLVAYVKANIAYGKQIMNLMQFNDYVIYMASAESPAANVVTFISKAVKCFIVIEPHENDWTVLMPISAEIRLGINAGFNSQELTSLFEQLSAKYNCKISFGRVSVEA